MTHQLSPSEAYAVDRGFDASVHTYNIGVLWADGSFTEANEMAPQDVADMVAVMVAMPGLERLNQGEPDPKTSAITITIAINPHE